MVIKKLRAFLAFIAAAFILSGAESVSDANKHLFQAIRNDSVDVISDAVNQGADPNGFDEKGRSPLLVALSERKHHIFVWLLTVGADPNGKANRRGDPLLRFFAGPGALAYLESYIKFGGDLTTTINGIGGPESYASMLSRTDRVDLLHTYLAARGPLTATMKDFKGRPLWIGGIEAMQYRMAYEILKSIGPAPAEELFSKEVEKLLSEGDEGMPARFRYWRERLISEISTQRRNSGSGGSSKKG